ncbi:SDR family NAD(P)-dependent oxidoreductase [Haloplasma contractile]|uniref:Dehydrogenase-reductase SDR family member 4 protein n=1 Tax=Haloplasma contractile SSD-17B TaxID=1033810 RepID=F7Q161_9MOLU|nr:SDR family NAD(P)-dependent oxidoreductase [Haloplasma contractile]ERJ11298.1 dehydrogenase-reductase SDR family member 4 protein [Haloplasma contractile SSD-17B]
MNLLISKGNLVCEQLKGQVAIVTGGGGGIGYETCRALIWLGVTVIIAEINKKIGKSAEKTLNEEFREQKAHFIHCDISKEKDVRRLYKKVINSHGKVDILINNATVAPMGAVDQVGIKNWDLSYRVNLRGPVLLVTCVLNDMLKRDSGVIVMVPSSGAAPYMGAYEVFKTAQIELSNTLAGELEDSNVITYSIGPGIVKTETAHKAIEQVAPLYNKTVAEFYRMSEDHLLTVEQAGAGFAASIVLKEKYRGLEIGSVQALVDAGITIKSQSEDQLITLSDENKRILTPSFNKIQDTYCEQIGDWKNRPIFERQWLIRDFKKTMGTNPEEIRETLKSIHNTIDAGLISKDEFIVIHKIKSYYLHQLDLLKGYAKSPEILKEHSQIIERWIEDIELFNKEFTTIIEEQSNSKSDLI